jgi:hypothetical protein
VACGSVGLVPAALINWAAGVIGIPCAVVRAQINDESGGSPDAVSSTGALGVAQFEPGTWAGEGCTGSPTNVNDAMKCYAKYMYSLVKSYKGNIRDALAAYNAGPANIAAGYPYADSILAAAGQPQTATAKGGSGNAAEPSTPQTAQTASDILSSTTDPACAWGISASVPGASSLPVIGKDFKGGICFVKKATLRHAAGGLLLAAGGLIALPGVIVLAAFSFRGSGAASSAARAAETLAPVPGYGHAIRYAQQRPQRRQAKARATATAARQQQRAAATTRRQQLQAGNRTARQAAGTSTRQQSRAVRGQAPRRQIAPAARKPAAPRHPAAVHHGP